MYVPTYTSTHTLVRKKKKKKRKISRAEKRKRRHVVFQACINKFQGERTTRTGLLFFGLLLLFFLIFSSPLGLFRENFGLGDDACMI